MEKEKNPKLLVQSIPPNLPIEEEKSSSRVVWRILILGAVLVVLVVLSIGIIKLVPKALSSLASVNVSISSLFTPNKPKATSTPLTVSTPSATTTNNYFHIENPQIGNSNATNPRKNQNNYPSSGNSNNSVGTVNNGAPDLEVTITSIGTLERNTGAFIPNTNVNTNDRVAVKFQVENVGNGPSGPWNLSAALPAVNPSDQIKNLYNQISIPAGMAVSGELYFDYVQTGQSRLVKIVISNNKPELQTANNSAQVTINATGGNYGNYNGGITSNGVDLAIQIIDTGTVDRSTGQYSQTNYISSGNRAGVRFRVTNQGTLSSGSWNFSATLPNSNNNCSYNYGNNCNNANNNLTQSNQASLTPGESRIYILGFDGMQYGSNNSVTINLDPYNQTNDVNRGNNNASVNISVNNY